jgi:hypothetical protein
MSPVTNPFHDPVKPCLKSKSGRHCWHASGMQHMVPAHLDVLCCWCDEVKCVSLEEEEGHGPHASRLTVPAEIKRDLAAPDEP